MPSPTANEEFLRTWQIFVEPEKLPVLLAEATRTAIWIARIKKHCASWNSTMMDFAMANRCEKNRSVDVLLARLFRNIFMEQRAEGQWGIIRTINHVAKASPICER
jgi:hypothetical protein